MKPWRFLYELYKPRLPWLSAAFLCLALTWIAGAALLAVSGWFITACAMAGLGIVSTVNLFTPSAAIRALAILRTLGRYAERVIGHEAILRILADLRGQAFRALAFVPAVKSASALRHTDVVGRLVADVDTLDAVPLRVIGPAVAGALTWLTAVAVAAFWGTTLIAGIIAISGMAVGVISVFSAKLGRNAGKRVIESRAAQKVLLMDHIRGMAELKVFNRIEPHAQALRMQDKIHTAHATDQEIIGGRGEHIVQYLSALVVLLVVLSGWHSLEPTVLALLALMAFSLNEAFGSLPGACWRIGESEQAAKRLMGLTATKSQNAGSHIHAVTAVTALHTTPVNTGLVLIENLQCQRQMQSIKPWSVQIQRGVPLVIYGQSGCGKSSLLQTLAGELAPKAGRVQLAGVDLLALPDEQRYGILSFLDQSDQLFDVTIGEFLRLGTSGLPESALREALERVDLIKTLDETPEGLAYRLGIRGSRISGGQARRLQLAALTLKQPDLVLLDEPFRGLEADLIQTILHRLEPWLSQRCCVIVTHDPDALPPQWARYHWPNIS